MQTSSEEELVLKFLSQLKCSELDQITLYRVFYGKHFEDVKDRERMLDAIAQNPNIHKIYLIVD